MAKRKDTDLGGGEGAASPQPMPEQASIHASATDPIEAAAAPALPLVESPSISPANSEPVAIEEHTIHPKPEPEVEAAKTAPVFALVHVPQGAQAGIEAPLGTAKPRFTFKPRYKRYVRMAASVAIGAAFGAAVGAVMTGGFATAPRPNVAALEENKLMQQSVTKLAKEVTTLKANLEAAKKTASDPVARTTESLQKEPAEITGSIAAPQTFSVAPVPTPRPAPRIAMAETRPPARPPVVQGWSIRDARGGYVYVEGHGDIYQIVPGAPLPGLGPVESVKKLEGRWVVTTPRGIIVSMRDRRFFE
jgi:hypothetical protein